MSRPVVYFLVEAEPGVEGIVRCTGDVDDFTAAAWAHLATNPSNWTGDVPMGLLPPVFRWWRWVPGTEYNVLNEAKGPGRGAWYGALIRVRQIGCSICQLVGGAHADGCLNADITGLVTCQFGGHKRGVYSWIHAVRKRAGIRGVRLPGTPGPTLCGIERFNREAPGWSLSGGVIDNNVDYHGCYQCGKVALNEFPGRAIHGNRRFAEAFSASTGVPLPAHLDSPTAPWRTHPARVADGCVMNPDSAV